MPRKSNATLARLIAYEHRPNGPPNKCNYEKGLEAAYGLIDGPLPPSLRRAFEAFGLDPADHSNWGRLLSYLAEALFGQDSPATKRHQEIG